MVKCIINKVVSFFNEKNHQQQTIQTSFYSNKDENNKLSKNGIKIVQKQEVTKQQDYFDNLVEIAEAFDYQEKGFHSPREGQLIQEIKLIRIEQGQEQTSFNLDIISKEENLGDEKVLILELVEKDCQGDDLKKKIEELENLHKYKDNLLATVSHDFKTPLNGMILITSFLEGVTMDHQQLKYLDIIKKNAYMLQYMIHDIIDFSKMSKGLLSVNPQFFSLDQIINEVLELMRLQAQEKGIELIYQNNQIFDELFNDPNRLKQVLINLMSNSLKFTPSGTIIVKVQEGLIYASVGHPIREQSRSSIKITITDTGVGIPDNIKPKLFDMWATFDHNNGSNKNGAGLGLVICQKIVGLLGPTNKIELDSQVGVGTSMAFQIFVNLPSSEKDSLMRFSSRALSPKNIRKQNSQKNDHLKFMSRGNSFNQSQIFQHMKNSNRFQIPSNQTVKHEQPRQFYSNIEILEDSRGEKFYNLNQTSTQQMKNLSSIKQNFRKEKVNHRRIESVTYHKSKDIPLDNQIQENEIIYQLLSHENQEKPLNILIVDDEVFNVMALKLVLQQFTKLNIHEAFDGRQAIQLIDEKKYLGYFYNCIFMDLTMGVMDGITAGRLIKQKVDSQFIPPLCLIALSGHDDEREKQVCFSVGFDGFLAKPFNIGELIDLLQELRYVSEA